MDVAGLMVDEYAVWVEFRDARVLLRYVPMHEIHGIRREAGRMAGPGREVDVQEAARLLGRRAVRGWEGLTLGGEPYPYTPENCDLLMTRWGEFARFVGEGCVDLGRLVMEREAALEKKGSSPK